MPSTTVEKRAKKNARSRSRDYYPFIHLVGNFYESAERTREHGKNPFKTRLVVRIAQHTKKVVAYKMF